MSFSLKAPALALGLSLYAVTSLFAQNGFTVDESGGIIWTQSDGGCFYFSQGAELRGGGWNFSVNAGQLKSSLPWFSTDAGMVYLNGEVYAGYTGLNIGLGLYGHDKLEAGGGKETIKNGGGKGGLIALTIPFRFGGFGLDLSCVYAASSWDNGSFYWFNGRPSLDGFYGGGLSLSYGGHSLLFHTASTDGNILSPQDERLFDWDLYVLHSAWQYSRESGRFEIRAGLGAVWGAANLEGALTASNQHYALFPYLFYEVEGTVSALIGHGGLELKYHGRFFEGGIALVAVQTMRSNSEASIHYKQKNLFGGAERLESHNPPDLGKAGCVFLAVDAGMILSSSLGRASNPRFKLGLKKTFALPWGYAGLLPPEEGGPPASGGGFDAGLLRTILLSGFSLYGSLNLR
jgi:hypothetical protein